MSAVLDELMQAPELALWEEQIAARLREERAKCEQFYRDITPDMKAEFINGDFVLHSPVTVRHNLVGLRLSRLLSVHVSARQLGQVSSRNSWSH